MADPRGEFTHGYTCEEVVELATDYLDGAMTPRQMTEFELHLNFCDGCFRFVDQVRTTSSMAHVLSEEQIPDELKAKVLAAFKDLRRE